MTRERIRVIGAAGWLAVLCGCAASSADRHFVPAASTDEAIAVHKALSEEDGRDAKSAQGITLQAFATDVLTDGRTAKIRGLVKNPFAEPVEGIRAGQLDLSC